MIRCGPSFYVRPDHLLKMPVIQIDIRKGRTREQIDALQRAVTDAVVETIGAPREYVYVLVREEEGPNHAIAGRSLPDWKPRRKA